MKGPQIAAASSLSNFLRVFMGGVGVSIVTTTWEKREALHHTQLAEQITPYSHATREAVQGMMQAGMSEQQAYGSIVRSISQQGFIIGSNEIFWVGSVLFVLMIAVIWFAKPPFGSGAGGGH
mgnify:FL=1